MRLLDLKEHSSSIRKLSGGERQRAAIAGKRFTIADIILADEPTASLDTEGPNAWFICLKELLKFNKSVVMITHDTRLLDGVDKIYEI